MDTNHLGIFGVFSFDDQLKFEYALNVRILGKPEALEIMYDAWVKKCRDRREQQRVVEYGL
jgi:hypothetical protein